MYKGQLTGFPKEVVEKMLFYQEQQVGIKDVTVFERYRPEDHYGNGFSWSITPEGQHFWDAVIVSERFDLFFVKYPKQPEQLTLF